MVVRSSVSNISYFVLLMMMMMLLLIMLCAAASLASRDVDYCLIPEIPIHLTTLLRHIKYTLKVKGHAVIVAAEGAGEHLGIIIIII